MKEKKAFDCVEMKWEIQRRLREQSAGLSEEEARRRQREKILADPLLAPLLTRALAERLAPAK